MRGEIRMRVIRTGQMSGWQQLFTAAAVLGLFGVLAVFPSAAQAGSSLAVTWTQQAPATSPPARYGASMAYDAATSTVVLFGGSGSGTGGQGSTILGDTWTWDGSTWTKQAPAT